ncbi:Peptidyl-prolyl cis-trans isomerase FKBP16-3, chloroplastic [Senna tora]|uniref:peptidylprolyl isomerase n=1 Tax=Senna tora TaxID=362788 RepID=A0A834SKH8_9FABA|nr:Peptidyl-prolyl cis-trans isomerase FKBP16-3, chloroplastic [Senna tora]
MRSVGMASSVSSLLVPLDSYILVGSSCGKNQGISDDKVRCLGVQLWSLDVRVKASRMRESTGIIRRDFVGLCLGVPSLLQDCFDAKAAGLPPEEKPRLCDDTCEKELENVPMVTTESGLQYKDIKVGQGSSPPVGFQVAANYVAMVPSGQIFDSSLEKGQPYIFRVGSGQVIKGLDEGILSMKIGGKRRLYIPGSLAFPKGLTSAPGRPRVAPNSPVIFDVSLEYIPGLELDEE